jgi:DNA repair protein RadC
MNSTPLSDIDLLSKLVGKGKAKRMFKGSLSALLVSEAGNGCDTLMAARELVLRSLAEEMAKGDCLTSTFLVRTYLRTILKEREHEVFFMILLDTQYRAIRAEELFRGTIDHSPVYAREVVKMALRHNASAVIFAHNHPSGDSKPSLEDIATTHELVSALRLIEVGVVDHLLVAGNQCISFRERGWIK